MRYSSIPAEPARAPLPPRALRALLYADVGAILSSQGEAMAGPLLTADALPYAGGGLLGSESSVIHDRRDLTRALRGGSVAASRGESSSVCRATASATSRVAAPRVSVFSRAGRVALSVVQPPCNNGTLSADDRVTEDALEAKAVAAVHTALYSQHAHLNELTAASAAESATIIERETMLAQLTKQLAHLQNMAGDVQSFGADADAGAGGGLCRAERADGSVTVTAPLRSPNAGASFPGDNCGAKPRAAVAEDDGVACGTFPRPNATTGTSCATLRDTAILAQIRDLNRESETLGV